MFKFRSVFRALRSLQSPIPVCSSPQSSIGAPRVDRTELRAVWLPGVSLVRIFWFESFVESQSALPPNSGCETSKVDAFSNIRALDADITSTYQVGRYIDVIPMHVITSCDSSSDNHRVFAQACCCTNVSMRHLSFNLDSNVPEFGGNACCVEHLSVPATAINDFDDPDGFSVCSYDEGGGIDMPPFSPLCDVPFEQHTAAMVHHDKGPSQPDWIRTGKSSSSIQFINPMNQSQCSFLPLTHADYSDDLLAIQNDKMVDELDDAVDSVFGQDSGRTSLPLKRPPKLKVVSYNSTGLANLKSFLLTTDANVVCNQEHWVLAEDLDNVRIWCRARGWASYWAPAFSAGPNSSSAGTAIFVRHYIQSWLPDGISPLVWPNRGNGVLINAGGLGPTLIVSMY